MTMNKPYYPNLEAEISKNGMKKKDIANMLNITPRAFAEKMTGRVDFWWKEVGIIQNLFPDIPAEKLFEHTP
ncbi:hypothetical protein [Huintestinicola sp.]|uniref:hypothetical protein n=1 Tax=Huintestinicola sp. TaxID=2981661 RepID=UPI00307B941C